MDGYIRHKDSMDVCFHIMSSMELGDRTRFTGRWVNMGYNNSWYVDESTVTIKVMNDNFKDLYVLNHADADKVDCLRYANWEKVK